MKIQAKRLILFWIWLMMLVAYVDRVNIAIAGPALMRALHMSKSEFGVTASAFQLGYALMQVPGGFLADRFGATGLLVAALIAWSIFTALTGAARSLGQMIGIRVLFGLGEGVENGAQFKLIADHFDSRERSSANALFLTALALGPALTSPITAWLLATVGWRGVFTACAGLGLIVAALMAVFLPRAAAEGASDRGKSISEPRERVPWKTALGDAPPWLAFAAYLLFNIGFWGFIYWFPTYLSESRHIDIKRLGIDASIPYLCGFAGMIVMGQLGAHALAKRRPLLVGCCYLLAAACFFVTYTAHGVTLCIAGLSAAAFFLYGGFGPFWAIALDLIPENLRGALSGFVNFGGQIGGFIAPMAIGRIVDTTRSFTDGFLFMIAALILAAILLFRLQGLHPRQLPKPE